MIEAVGSPEIFHPESERKRIISCQKLVRKWIENPNFKSLQVLPEIYANLFGITHWFRGKKNMLTFSDVMRTDERVLLNHPEAIIAPYEEVRSLMYGYTDKLDELLETLPKSPSGRVTQIVQKATLAYYVFEKIHPFPEGNGRIGRMILKRFLKGSGFRDIIFHSDRWYTKGRSPHLQDMAKVDLSGNIAFLELNLLKSLNDLYINPEDINLRQEISNICQKKENEIKQSMNSITFSQIWADFQDLPS